MCSFEINRCRLECETGRILNTVSLGWHICSLSYMMIRQLIFKDKGTQGNTLLHLLEQCLWCLCVGAKNEDTVSIWLTKLPSLAQKFRHGSVQIQSSLIALLAPFF